MATIHIIEDDPKTADLIRLYLENESYRVLVSHDGKEGFELARVAKPDLLILDRMLPNMEGLEILKEIRAQERIPIIFLSAKSDEIEKIIGLELGADDYMSKPFSLKELVARIKTILRRSQNKHDDLSANIHHGTLHMDASRMEVTLNGAPIELSAKEFKLLHHLASHPGQVFTREQLMEKLYESSQNWVFDRTVDAHIKNLRKKLNDNPKKPAWIASIFGVGYKFINHEIQSEK